MTHEDDNKLKELDLKIAKAMQIDVPPLVMPELPDVDTDKVATLPTRKRTKRSVMWFAVAASIVLASSIALRMTNPFQTYDTLAEEILAHMDHEPQALVVTDVAVSDARLQRVVPSNVADFAQSTALITYANPCKINGKLAPHLVVQGQYGPVTIILMPEEFVAEITPLNGASVHGMIVPVGEGSIAIVGSREEALEPIRENLIESVTWTT